MSIYYKLNEDKTVSICTQKEYFHHCRDDFQKHLGDDDIFGRRVSTVFLGINHNFYGKKPILFETMIFDYKNADGDDIYSERYSTWDEAKAGHERAIQWVLNGCKPEDIGWK